MSDLTFYGASDHLVEVEGAIREEYELGREGTRLRLTAPDGDTLDVYLNFGYHHATLDWAICVEAVGGYPSWPVRFHERPDREGDPAVTVGAPAGTTIAVVR